LIATNVPGCRDVTIAGRSGILIQPRDAAALATAMRTLADDSDARRTLGDGARSLARERFASEIVTGDTLELYEQILSKPPHSTRPHRRYRTGATSGAECMEKR